jgi:hypothetical protein
MSHNITVGEKYSLVVVDPFIVTTAMVIDRLAFIHGPHGHIFRGLGLNEHQRPR